MSAIGTAGVLDAIVAASKTIVDGRRMVESCTALERRAMEATPRGGEFRAALAAAGAINVIAECKRRSPAKGVLVAAYDPARSAAAYESAGAAAVSVLTEPTFFDGALDHVRQVRAVVSIPVLRKDFIVDEYQLLEARAAGADAVLLIVAALAPDGLCRLVEQAKKWGLAALVETHTSDEVRAAVDAGATIIGVNSRNLKTLAVDLSACDRLVGEIPPGTVAVAESGVASVADAKHLHGLGFDAVLIGEWLMKAPDPAGTIREVRAACGSRPAPLEGGSR